MGDDVTPEDGELYVQMCPAGFHEMDGDELRVNAPNCVDCKATDVLGPTWRLREGGVGRPTDGCEGGLSEADF